MNSYQDKDLLPVPESHVAFLQTLHTYFTCEQFIFVHAGMRPEVPLEDQDEFDLLWIRREFLTSEYDWGRTVVYGHTPL
ncbi:MAG: serine/threonine protein phosphatase, partial [Gammaproteobacteria bacterium]|nr:serine/threonine protein phosphatase [Gammaproteobacteria bacterium]